MAWSRYSLHPPPPPPPPVPRAAGKRQVLWIWVSEEDGNGAARGWQGTQSLPRTMTYDPAVQLLAIDALPELAQLRNATLSAVGSTAIPAGGFIPLPGAMGQQLEIDAYFALPQGASSPDAAFGVAVLARPDGALQTRVQMSYAQGGVAENNTDRPGSDFLIFDMDPTAPEAWNVGNCSAACAANATCQAWTYVRPGDGQCRCCLKNPIPAANSNPYCVSGVRNTTLMVSVNRTASGTDGNTDTRGGPVPTAPSDAPVVRLHIFVDHSIVETFVNGGRARIITRLYVADPTAQGVAVFAEGVAATLLNATVWSLDSAWGPVPQVQWRA
jgi:hypothetical protein